MTLSRGAQITFFFFSNAAVSDARSSRMEIMPGCCPDGAPASFRPFSAAY